MFQKSFTQYHMFIKQGRLSWRVVKRFSDYVALHDDLRDNKANAGYPIDVTTLPKLPRKTLPGLNKLSDSLVQVRWRGAGTHLSDILAHSMRRERYRAC